MSSSTPTAPPAHPSPLRRRQTNNSALMDRTRQRQPLRPRPIVSALNTLELLHQSDGRIASFRQCELFCILRQRLVS